MECVSFIMRKQRRNIFYGLPVILLTACGVGRNASFSPERKFAPEKLKKDFTILRNIYEKSHPGIYWYTPKDSIDYYFDKGFAALNDSMTEPQFKNILSQAIEHLQCGHSSTKFSKKYDNYLFDTRRSQFPLQLKVTADSLIHLFDPNPADSFLYRGAVIKSINGISAKQLIDTMASIISTDGIAMNFKYQQLTNSFAYYHRSLFGVSKEYTITYLNKFGNETTSIVKPYDPSKDSGRRREIVPLVERTRREIRKEKQQQTFSFFIDSTNRLAVLNVNNFGSHLKKRLIKKAFKKIDRLKIKNIVLDMRLNGGGLINKSIYLAKFLKEAPFSFMDSVVTPKKKLTAPGYVKQRLLYNLGLWWFAKKGNDGNYHFRYYENRIYPLKDKYHFNGHIYIVTGGNTFSAASLFVASLKGQSNVTVVGEETGGGYYGNNGVFIPDIILPNTFIRVRLPLFRIVNNVLHIKDGHGVKPDIEVAPTAKTIMLNIDPKIEKVKELVKQHQ
ncbi:MAG: hypothetical protein EKK37_15115 [Sphingobacteriales bacterium]|nr:MAG: hypothetical protein EKK37_15115 [Sphingobacteriales bacterium]